MSWQRIRGHDALVESFRRVFRRRRLAHAYLFIGPPGVGKRLFASELSRALLCDQTGPWEQGGGERPLEACDACPSCVQFDAGNHPDFLAVQRHAEKNEFTVDLMREVLGRMALKPMRNQGKVALLDDVDDLNEEAANCFLKTLEEPPPRSLLILVGTSLDRQLPTIVSRCQVVRFAPLNTGLVAELLGAGGVEDGDHARRLAALSEGSPGVASALCDPALWEFRRSLLECLSSQPLRSVDFSQQWGKFVEEAGKESALQRRRASLCLHLLLSLLQDALRVSLGGTARLESPEERRILEGLAARLSPEQILRLLERTMQADEQIDRYVQLILVLEALMEALAQRLEPTRR